MLNILQALFVHLCKEQLVSIHGERRLCGLDKAGPVAFFRVAVKGELAHHQSRIAKVLCAEIQLALCVRKDAQARAFIGKLGHDVQTVGIPDTQQDHKARPDGPRLTAVYPHTGGRHRLNDCTHVLAPCHLEHVPHLGKSCDHTVEVLGIVDADGQADHGAVVFYLTGVHGVDGHPDIGQSAQHIPQQLVAVQRHDLKAGLVAVLDAVGPVSLDPAGGVGGILHAGDGIDTALLVDGHAKTAGDKAHDGVAGQRAAALGKLDGGVVEALHHHTVGGVDLAQIHLGQLLVLALLALPFLPLFLQLGQAVGNGDAAVADGGIQLLGVVLAQAAGTAVDKIVQLVVRNDDHFPCAAHGPMHHVPA